MNKQEMMIYEIGYKYSAIFLHPINNADASDPMTQKIMEIMGCKNIDAYNQIRKKWHEKHLASWSEQNQGAFI